MEALHVNGLDLAVGAVLLVSALLAFIRGFVHEVLSIAAWVGAVAASIYGLPYAQPFAHGLIPIGWAADAAAAAIIFLVVLFVLSAATHAVARAIQKTALNNLDRTLGFVFGLARAVAILAVGLIITDWLTDRQRPEWMRTAKTLPLIEVAADGLKAIVPSSFMVPPDIAKDGLRRANEALDAKKAFDSLSQPGGVLGAGAAARPATDVGQAGGGYQNRERLDMERLIQSKEGQEPAAEDKP